MSCNYYFNQICTVIVIWQFLRITLPWIYRTFIGPAYFGPRIDLKKMGEWALITGATDGIGKSYAKELAKEGLNLILISRSREKLQKVAKEIETTSNVNIKIIDVDFTHNKEIYEKIDKEISGLEIGIIVNNVGLSYSYPEYFLSIPNSDQFFQDIVACNIHSVLYMCKLVMPGMVKRKKGVVINISSIAAKIPNPLLSVYSATKAFIDKFSEDLRTEYKQYNIIVQSVLPGLVATNMSKLKKATYTAPYPDTFVKSALKTLGIANHTNGYIPHSLMQGLINFIQELVCTSFATNLVFKHLLAVRHKSLRKAT